MSTIQTHVNELAIADNGEAVRGRIVELESELATTKKQRDELSLELELLRAERKKLLRTY